MLRRDFMEFAKFRKIDKSLWNLQNEKEKKRERISQNFSNFPKIGPALKQCGLRQLFAWKPYRRWLYSSFEKETKWFSPPHTALTCFKLAPICSEFEHIMLTFSVPSFPKPQNVVENINLASFSTDNLHFHAKFHQFYYFKHSVRLFSVFVFRPAPFLSHSPRLSFERKYYLIAATLICTQAELGRRENNKISNNW